VPAAATAPPHPRPTAPASRTQVKESGKARATKSTHVCGQTGCVTVHMALKGVAVVREGGRVGEAVAVRTRPLASATTAAPVAVPTAAPSAVDTVQCCPVLCGVVQSVQVSQYVSQTTAVLCCLPGGLLSPGCATATPLIGASLPLTSRRTTLSGTLLESHCTTCNTKDSATGREKLGRSCG
jgi:hypothetical protein